MDRLATIATPASVLAVEPLVTVSVTSLKLPVNRVVTVEPAGEAVSSFTAVSVELPLATGASFTATMVVPSVTALLLSLYLVVPPLVPAVFRSTVASAAGAVEDESTRRTVRAPGMPFQLGTGLNFRL